MFEITEKKNIKKISKKSLVVSEKDVIFATSNKQTLELAKTLTFTNKICEAIRNYIATKDLEMVNGTNTSAFIGDYCIHYSINLVRYRTFRINVWLLSHKGVFAKG